MENIKNTGKKSYRRGVPWTPRGWRARPLPRGLPLGPLGVKPTPNPPRNPKNPRKKGDRKFRRRKPPEPREINLGPLRRPAGGGHHHQRPWGDLRGAIIAMKAKDQRENLSPSRGAMKEEAQGGESLLLSLGGAGVPSAGESSPR